MYRYLENYITYIFTKRHIIKKNTEIIRRKENLIDLYLSLYAGFAMGRYSGKRVFFGGLSWARINGGMVCRRKSC